MAGANVSELSKGNLAFSTSLYGALRSKIEPQGNLFYSPASLEIAIGLLYAGADGTTAQEIAKVLSLPASREKTNQAFSSCMTNFTRDQNVTLNIANGLFVKQDKKLKQAYLDVATKFFASRVQGVEFGKEEAVTTINQFVAKETNNKITQLFESDSFDSLTLAVLVNAIYFKGNWASKFKPEATFKGDFFLNEKDTVKVDFMRQKNDYNVGYVSDIEATVVVLPYAGEKISMVLLVPDATEGLKKIEENLKNLNLVQIAKDTNKTEIILSMPKFKVAETVKLKDVLQAIGLGDMFSDKANFSGLSDINDVYVSDVVQKTYIEVSEEGTEAAAATGVTLLCRCMPLPPQEINVKSPFMFYLLDTTSDLVLFVGRLSKP